MFLLNLVTPAQPAAQHAVRPAKLGRAKDGPAKPKEPNILKKALDKLSLRERVMLVVLIILVVAALVVFLVALPALNQITELNAEITELEQQKSEVRIEPDRTPEYQAAYEAALKDFENYQRFYYPFMDPETIDKTVTNMLLANDLEPVRLTMSTLQVEPLSVYSASQTLVPRPVPAEKDKQGEQDAKGAEGTEGEQGAEGAEGDEGAEDESADEGGSRADNLASAAESAGGLTTEGVAGEAPAGSLIYCYTVNVEATGWMYQMFSFLEGARTITAMEIVSYAYTAPDEVAPSSSKTTNTQVKEPEGGTIIMQIKLYVFVGDELTATEASAS
jgi:cell division protein FtsL